jgi:hypothetical protein
MQVERRIRKRIRRATEGINLEADLSATVVVNSATDRGTTPRQDAGPDRPRGADQGKEKA